MSPELPACAAIRWDHGPNTTELIIAGKRHHDCLNSARFWGVAKQGGQQGFMTNRGRFVDRHGGKLLMELAGMESADPGGYRGDELFSEDLY